MRVTIVECDADAKMAALLASEPYVYDGDKCRPCSLPKQSMTDGQTLLLFAESTHDGTKLFEIELVSVVTACAEKLAADRGGNWVVVGARLDTGPALVHGKWPGERQQFTLAMQPG